MLYLPDKVIFRKKSKEWKVEVISISVAIPRKWNVSFSCFWKFGPLDRFDSLRKEIRGQKESRQMKISKASEGREPIRHR